MSDDTAHFENQQTAQKTLLGNVLHKRHLLHNKRRNNLCKILSCRKDNMCLRNIRQSFAEALRMSVSGKNCIGRNVVSSNCKQTCFNVKTKLKYEIQSSKHEAKRHDRKHQSRDRNCLEFYFATIFLQLFFIAS